MRQRSARERAAHLRRIAAAEIARHREALGFLGAALEGSLATGAVWPTSDVDFTLVPHPEQTAESLMEWERRESLPFLKDHGDHRLHVDVCGQRDGIPWHKHLTDPRALRDLLEGYPDSFIRFAEGPFNPGATWYLDGVAVMEVIDDREGLLEETRRFVADHRFAPEVWERRRAALLQELCRQRDQAHAAMDSSDVDAAYQILASEAGFAAVAAQLWLERARQICSRKEQDGRLDGITQALGCPEAHALYRHTLGVEPERARAVVSLLRQLREHAERVYHLMGTLPTEEPERLREAAVWGAYAAHLIGTLSLAPGRGHPAFIYQSLPSILHWTIDYPAQATETLRQRGVPGVSSLDRAASELAELAEKLAATLLDPRRSLDRVRGCLAAADQLLDLTGSRV